MTISRFCAEVTSYLPFLPAAFLCYLPVKNQLKYERKKVFLVIFLVFFVCFPVVSYFKCIFSLLLIIWCFFFFLFIFFIIIF